MRQVDTLVSVVVLSTPVDIDQVPSCVAVLSDVLSTAFAHHEIVVVYEGDRSRLSRVLPTLQSIPSLRFVHLARSANAETAVLAGLDTTIGDIVVTLQPALDPPDAVPRIAAECRGVDVVIGVTNPASGRSVLYRLLREIFVVVARRTLGVAPVRGSTLFRAFSRFAVNSITRSRLRQPYFALTLFDIGLSTTTFAYEQLSATTLHRRKPVLAAIRIGLAVIVRNSLVPLRFVSVLGLFGSLASVLYSGYAVMIYLVKTNVMPGWTTLSLQTSGLFLLLFLMLSLLAEYLERLLEELSARPIYHVKEELTTRGPDEAAALRNVVYSPEGEEGHNARDGHRK